MQRKFHITTLIVIILAALFIKINPAAANDPNADALREGILQLEDGTPGSFALVEFYAPDGSVTMVVTNRQGAFDYSHLEPGKYVLVISTTNETFGFVGMLEIGAAGEPVVFEGASLIGADVQLLSASVEVAVEQPLAITLATPGMISGNVADCGTECAVIVTYDDVVIAFSETDAEGNFSLSNIAPGDYEITAYSEKWNTEPAIVTVGNAEEVILSLSK